MSENGTPVSAGAVRLRYGSVINLDDLGQLNDEFVAAQDELDRARRLAAKLEEVVAMRNNVLRALVDWKGAERDTGANGNSLYAIIDWAKAQLSEVP